MRVLITGGAGFIGSALVRMLIRDTDHHVCVFDALTYSGSLAALDPVKESNRYCFVQGDICDRGLVQKVIDDFNPSVITHLAAESHVDRSLDGPDQFIKTNVVGTYEMLEAARKYWKGLSGAEKSAFRFHHISTDEVFGSLGDEGLFSEQSPYDPRSPYSASKAGSDHLASAWFHSFGLPVLITNCSNNYGPYQNPEKLIPLMIAKALNGEALPVYGSGANVRDWLYVDDHVEALRTVFEQGEPGRTYNIGGNAEMRNIEVVKAICDVLDKEAPTSHGRSYRQQIEFVTDRPGHDARYAIDTQRINDELNWSSKVDFQTGLEKTVQWYLANRDWWQELIDTKEASVRRGLSS